MEINKIPKITTNSCLNIIAAQNLLFLHKIIINALFCILLTLPQTSYNTEQHNYILQF